MDPAQVLADVRRRGIYVYRHGDRLRLRPASAVTPEMVRQMTVMKARILPLVPVQASAKPLTLDTADPYRVLVDDVDFDELARAVRYHAEINGMWVHREVDVLDRDCARLREAHGIEGIPYRVAVSLLWGRLVQIQGWYRQHAEGRAPIERGPWRLVVEAMAVLPQGPIGFDGCSITDPGRLIALTFAALDEAASHKSASRESIFAEDVLIETHRERLHQLGVEALIVEVA